VILSEPGFRLGERGRRDRPGARRGESLFSLIWIEISNKRFWELSVVSFIVDFLLPQFQVFTENECHFALSNSDAQIQLISGDEDQEEFTGLPVEDIDCP
jgi:hypothetical protein